MFINNGQLELTPENSYIVMYPNDIMDGVLIDLDENYAFISAHSEGYKALADQLEYEGVEVYDLTQEELDLDQAPHSWVLASLARLIIHEAEVIA